MCNPQDITPNPAHFPSYRAPSDKDGPTFTSDAHRTRSASAFSTGANAYEDARPGYPDRVTALLDHADAATHTVLDVGAGTGKLTRALITPGRSIYACDPSGDMCRVLSAQLGLPVWRATAEATALSDTCLDAVTCAQTWHWVDTTRASAELARVVRPGGHLLLAWNTLDVHSDPWVLRLARIMHSGDIQREGFYPTVNPPWRLQHEERLTWTHTLTPKQLHLLMHTRSYWLRNTDYVHERMTNNLNWYLYEHMGFTPDQVLEIPYRTDAFLYRHQGHIV